MQVLLKKCGALGGECVAHGRSGARHLVSVGVATLRANGRHLPLGGRVAAV